MLIWVLCVLFFDYSDFAESFDLADSDDFSIGQELCMTALPSVARS